MCVIASTDAQSHVEQLKSVAQFLADSNHVRLLKEAKTVQDKHYIVDELNKGGF